MRTALSLLLWKEILRYSKWRKKKKKNKFHNSMTWAPFFSFCKKGRKFYSTFMGTYIKKRNTVRKQKTKNSDLSKIVKNTLNERSAKFVH